MLLKVFALFALFAKTKQICTDVDISDIESSNRLPSLLTKRKQKKKFLCLLLCFPLYTQVFAAMSYLSYYEDDNDDGMQYALNGDVDFGYPSFSPPLMVPAFPAFQRKHNQSGRPFMPRNKRIPFPGQTRTHQNVSQTGSTGRRADYWNEDGTGPILSQCRFAGNTLDLPKVAPLKARTEDKKIILVTTTKRLKNASGKDADWAAKTDFLVGRFLGLAPHAATEADLNLTKFKTFGSDMYDYGKPAGLTISQGPAPLNPTRWSGLRYLVMEMRIHPKRCLPDHLKVPGAPEFKTLEALLRLPLNENEDGLHTDISATLLQDPQQLIRLFEAQDVRIEFGMVNPFTKLFDTDLFRKELQKVSDETKFHVVEAILLRDYVGQGIITDVENRLQQLRQVEYSNGRRRIKPVAEFHADFMRVVQELDQDRAVPFNLASMEFHNLIPELKTALISNGYKLPTEISTLTEQYKNLSELLSKATEQERNHKQISDIVRNQMGFQQRIPNPVQTTAFWAPCTDNENWDTQVQEQSEQHDVSSEAFICQAFLSMAENALREASGEVAPLKCWGCGDIPSYASECFHRFGNCPHKMDPKVQANFKINIEKWQHLRRTRSPSPSPGRYGPAQAQRPSSPHVRFSNDTKPNQKMTSTVSVNQATTTQQPATDEQKSDEDLRDMLGMSQGATSTPTDNVYQTYFTTVSVRAPDIQASTGIIPILPADKFVFWNEVCKPMLTLTSWTDLVFMPFQLITMFGNNMMSICKPIVRRAAPIFRGTLSAIKANVSAPVLKQPKPKQVIDPKVPQPKKPPLPYHKIPEYFIPSADFFPRDRYPFEAYSKEEYEGMKPTPTSIEEAFHFLPTREYEHGTNGIVSPSNYSDLQKDYSHSFQKKIRTICSGTSADRNLCGYDSGPLMFRKVYDSVDIPGYHEGLMSTRDISRTRKPITQRLSIASCVVQTERDGIFIVPEDPSVIPLTIPGDLLSETNWIRDLRTNQEVNFVIKNGNDLVSLPALFTARHPSLFPHPLTMMESREQLCRNFITALDEINEKDKPSLQSRPILMRTAEFLEIPSIPSSGATTSTEFSQSQSAFMQKFQQGMRRTHDELMHELEPSHILNWYEMDERQECLFKKYQTTMEVREIGDCIFISFHFIEINMRETFVFNAKTSFCRAVIHTVVAYANFRQRPDVLLHFILQRDPTERDRLLRLIQEDLELANFDGVDTGNIVYFLPDSKDDPKDDIPQMWPSTEVDTTFRMMTSNLREMLNDMNLALEILTAQTHALQTHVHLSKSMTSAQNKEFQTREELHLQTQIENLRALIKAISGSEEMDKTQVEEFAAASVKESTDTTKGQEKQTDLEDQLREENTQELEEKEPSLPMWDPATSPTNRLVMSAVLQTSQGKRVKLNFLIDTGSKFCHINMKKIKEKASDRPNLYGLIQDIETKSTSKGHLFPVWFINPDETSCSPTVQTRLPIHTMFGTREIHPDFPYEGVIGMEYLSKYTECWQKVRTVQGVGTKWLITFNPTPFTRYSVTNVECSSQDLSTIKPLRSEEEAIAYSTELSKLNEVGAITSVPKKEKMVSIWNKSRTGYRRRALPNRGVKELVKSQAKPWKVERKREGNELSPTKPVFPSRGTEESHQSVSLRDILKRPSREVLFGRPPEGYENVIPPRVVWAKQPIYFRGEEAKWLDGFGYESAEHVKQERIKFYFEPNEEFFEKKSEHWFPSTSCYLNIHEVRFYSPNFDQKEKQNEERYSLLMLMQNHAKEEQSIVPRKDGVISCVLGHLWTVSRIEKTVPNSEADYMEDGNFRDRHYKERDSKKDLEGQQVTKASFSEVHHSPKSRSPSPSMIELPRSRSGSPEPMDLTLEASMIELPRSRSGSPEPTELTLEAGKSVSFLQQEKQFENDCESRSTSRSTSPELRDKVPFWYGNEIPSDWRNDIVAKYIALAGPEKLEESKRQDLIKQITNTDIAAVRDKANRFTLGPTRTRLYKLANRMSEYKDELEEAKRQSEEFCEIYDGKCRQRLALAKVREEQVSPCQYTYEDDMLIITIDKTEKDSPSKNDDISPTEVNGSRNNAPDSENASDTIKGDTTEKVNDRGVEVKVEDENKAEDDTPDQSNRENNEGTQIQKEHQETVKVKAEEPSTEVKDLLKPNRKRCFSEPVDARSHEGTYASAVVVTVAGYEEAVKFADRSNRVWRICKDNKASVNIRKPAFPGDEYLHVKMIVDNYEPIFKHAIGVEQMSKWDHDYAMTRITIQDVKEIDVMTIYMPEGTLERAYMEELSKLLKFRLEQIREKWSKCRKLHPNYSR